MTDHSARIRASLADKYTIERELGRGGMATVYLARDVKHDRLVAVKVLRPELAAALGADRFLREIRLTAQLQHPHILTLLDSGEAEGFLYYVMPYVEGESLRQLLERKGQLALDEALQITRVIASALDFAHGRGVIHRDIKPENVMLHQGEPMVADFGIALAVSSAGRDRLTETGVSVGTPAYMSPEQSSADPKLDGRSDQYSLASVLYEMLAGEPPYTGPTAHAIIAKRLTEPVPHLSTVRAVAPAVEAALTRALAKAPADRFPTTGAFAAALTREGKPRQPIRRRVALIAGAVVLVIGGAAATHFALTHTGARGEAPVIVPFTSSPGLKGHPVFSPDGNAIAYIWRGERNDNGDIYVQLDAGTPLRLTSSPDLDACPAWSPDGRSIAFLRMGDQGSVYYVVPALGGAERKVADAYAPAPEFGRCIDWTPDGKHLLVADKLTADEPRSSIILVSVEDGQRTLVARQPAPYVANATLSPDGRSIAYIAGAWTLTTDMYVVPAGGGASRRVTFDQTSIDGLTWSRDGKSLVFGSRRSVLWTLWRVPAAGGTPERITGVGENATEPAIAPRGDRLTYLYSRADWNVWRMPGPAWRGPAAERTARRLIASSRVDLEGSYSPDGTRIVFESDRSGYGEIWVADSDGRNMAQLTTLQAPDAGSPRWSPDGRTIVFDARLEGHGGIFAIAATGGSLRRLTTDSAESNIPTWSRDGKWVYYSSKRSGSWQIWKVPATGGTSIQVTADGGFTAQESPDGTALYVWEDGRQSVDRLTPSNGKREPILRHVGAYSFWHLGSRGIYFFDGWKTQAPLRLLDLATHHVRRIGTLDVGSFVGLPPTFDVSSDERWVLFDRADAIESDVLLIQNFH